MSEAWDLRLNFWSHDAFPLIEKPPPGRGWLLNTNRSDSWRII